MIVVELSKRSGISAVAFDVIWWKDDRNGGEIERKIESEMIEGVGEWRRHRKNSEHR